MTVHKPEFELGSYSPIAVATALHSFSRDMQSYCNIIRGNLISQLEQVSDEAELTNIQTELKAINQKLEYFHVLNNAASTVDTLLHTPVMIEEFCHPH